MVKVNQLEIMKVENKKVGWMIIGIAILMGFIILIFNLGLNSIVNEICMHGKECAMYNTISTQTWISVALVLVVLGIGFFIMNSKPEEKIVIKKVKEKNPKKKIDLKGLEPIEKKSIKIMLKEGKAMFQSDLKEKLGIGKVGMTRLLDRLEAKQFVERKRRGMNNIVVLKH